jgi:dolichol-phosphate mannosyltransferase
MSNPVSSPAAADHVRQVVATTSDLGRVLVTIPTYDERETLGPIIARLRAAVPEVDVLVVDDASPDGTGLLAERLAAGDPQVFALHRPGKAGLGVAYMAAFGWALERDYDVVVEMDADGSHAPEELPRLLAALRHADVVLGSRWVPGGEIRNWPWSRLALSRGGNAFVRLVLGLGLRDATGGFRAIRRPVLESLLVSEVASQGYCFQVDLVRRARAQGHVIAEVPITFVERELGTSKMSNAIVVEALVRVSAWGAQARWASIRRRAEQVGEPDRS